MGEQRRAAVVVVRHHRVGELAAQRLDLDAVSDGLKVAVCARLAVPEARSRALRSGCGPQFRLSATISSPTRAQQAGNRPADEPVAPVPATGMRSLPGEHGVDGEGVVHRGHAHLVPGQAEVGPVDAGLGAEPDLAVAMDRDRGIEGQGPGTVARSARRSRRYPDHTAGYRPR